MQNKITKILFSTRLTSVLFIVFAIAMATGTILDRNMDTSPTPYTRNMIYNAWWFEAIMVFFVINFVGNVFRFKLFKKEKWATLTLHLAFILILLGNYVLLLVDSVNALYDTFSEVIQGDFSFTDNSQRVHLLKVLIVFSLGSIVGLVSLSNVLAYLLKHYKKTTNAIIIGFIAGSLGVVWPWKNKITEKDAMGNIIYDANGREVITGYERYFPSEFSFEIIIAILFITIGILILLFLDRYHKIKLTSNG